MTSPPSPESDAPARRCPRAFISSADGEVCTCDRGLHRGGPHHCPVCGVAWRLGSELRAASERLEAAS
jgi:hypothetical protein